MKNRNIYIDCIESDAATKLFNTYLPKDITKENIPVIKSLGRITAEPAFAKISSPHFNASAMDGILVRAKDTYTANELRPIVLKQNKDFEYINTGNIIKNSFDAVIMIEDIIEIDNSNIQIIYPAYPWQNIRVIGEDIVSSEMVLKSNWKIRAIDLGPLISSGVETISVYKQPVIGVIPTGDELIENVTNLAPGKIIDSNSHMISGMITELGGVAKRYTPVKDIYNSLKTAVINAVTNCDIVIINAGASAGSKDYTSSVIKELGRVIVHGVALRPGGPTILGIIKNRPIIGLPGYPVSTYVSFQEFVKPIINRYTKQAPNEEEIVATSAKRVPSSLKHKEYVRVSLGIINDSLVANPLSRGAALTSGLSKADGLMIIPRLTEGIEASNSVKIKPLKELTAIEQNLISVGSHDIILDIISDKINFSSTHVGSLGGIISLQKNECHLAPIHLLDTSLGTYNTSVIKKHFPNKKMALIKGVKREQGLIVQKGNPLEVLSIADLLKKQCHFINRQRGSGTRVLLDFLLGKNKIDTGKISGYDKEVSTHMAVASAVSSNIATVGLGVKSAALALDLDFIFIDYEEYDFLIPEELLNDEKVCKFISVLKSKNFQEEISHIGGYKIENMGTCIL